LIDLNGIRETVVKGLKNYLSIPVVRSNQTGKPPRYPYLSYTITSLLSENNGTWGKYEDGKDRKPALQTWSITVQSDDSAEAMELAIKARDWLEHTGTVYLNDNHVIVQSLSGISNRDNLLTIEYEYRNGFDVVFWFLSETDGTEETAEYIETAEIKRV